MTEATLWWVLTGVVVALELASGTFYLLMLAIGLGGGAIAAHLGAEVAVQVTVAALVGGGAVLVGRSYKQKMLSALPAGANHDVNMDIGETVHVTAWNPDGSSTVHYRGASWQVALAPGDSPSAGPHRIVEVVGSRLIVRKI